MSADLPSAFFPLLGTLTARPSTTSAAADCARWRPRSKVGRCLTQTRRTAVAGDLTFWKTLVCSTPVWLLSILFVAASRQTVVGVTTVCCRRVTENDAWTTSSAGIVLTTPIQTPNVLTCLFLHKKDTSHCCSNSSQQSLLITVVLLCKIVTSSAMWRHYNVIIIRSLATRNCFGSRIYHTGSIWAGRAPPPNNDNYQYGRR